MKTLAQYDIDIQGLKFKEHFYEFEAETAFFEALEQDLIQTGQFKTTLRLEKSSTMLVLDFHIVGQVELICDRSLEEFQEPIDLTERLIMKFGDHNEELSDEILLIRHETVRINVAQTIFDYIALSLPMKRLHPSFRNEESNDEEGKLVFSSEMNVETEQTPDAEPKTTADPRWEALQKLKK